MARITEIENRLSEIANEIETREAELTEQEVTEFNSEVDSLREERDAIREVETRRQNLLNSIAEERNKVNIITRYGGMVDASAAAQNSDPYASPEYRSAWLKKIRNIPLTELEKRAYSNATGSGAEVIPTQTANDIISKVKTLAPMLNEITLLAVPGGVKYAVEGTNNSAAIHTENAAITASDDTLTTVSLSAYEIVKLVQISESVKTMSIPAFEGWLINMLAESLSEKIEDLIINGTGTSQPKGIEKANTWGADNSVTVTKTGSLTAANVQTLIGLLNAGYDREAKWLMNKRTLFTDFMPLQDNSKNHIVSVQNNSYYIYGYPVLLSDKVATNEAYLGAYKKVIANMPEQINVRTAYDIDTNSYKFSGVAMFDCIPAIGEAFVKLVKATA